MTRWSKVPVVAVAILLVMCFATPAKPASDAANEGTARYLLAAFRAFRTIYVSQVLERIQKVGIRPKEEWANDDHAVMLPFQFVKMAALEMKSHVKNVDIGLVSLTPLHTSNFPKTEVEVEALRKLLANPSQTVLTFRDGTQFKGISADFAIEQSCVDCHNNHPNAHKKDFKKGDIMGAIVVRLK